MPHEMSEQTYETAPGDIPTTGDGIPADIIPTTMEVKDLMKKMEELSYRIEEMEKKVKMAEDKKEEEKMAEVEIEIEKKEEEEMEEDEEDLPKLDGAPIEARVKKFSYTNTNKQTPGLSSQERVLARLYNK